MAAQLQPRNWLVCRDHLTGGRSDENGLSDEKGYDERFSAQGFFTCTNLLMDHNLLLVRFVAPLAKDESLNDACRSGDIC